MLKQTINIAYSNQTTWICESTDPDGDTDCATPGTVLYTKDNAASTGDRTIHVCGDRIMSLDGHQDGPTDASPTGALVHEISHLAGSWCDHQYGEDVVLQRAQDNNPFAPMFAEAYRYYVMHWSDN